MQLLLWWQCISNFSMVPRFVGAKALNRVSSISVASNSRRISDSVKVFEILRSWCHHVRKKLSLQKLMLFLFFFFFFRCILSQDGNSFWTLQLRMMNKFLFDCHILIISSVQLAFLSCSMTILSQFCVSIAVFQHASNVWTLSLAQHLVHVQKNDNKFVSDCDTQSKLTKTQDDM